MKYSNRREIGCKEHSTNLWFEIYTEVLSRTLEIRKHTATSKTAPPIKRVVKTVRYHKTGEQLNFYHYLRLNRCENYRQTIILNSTHNIYPKIMNNRMIK